MTALSNREVQEGLKRLGYYDGRIDDNALGARFRDDLRRFQADYGLQPDGWYGPDTEGKLKPLLDQLARAPTPPAIQHLLRWKATYYYIGEQARATGPLTIPVKSPQGKVLATVEPHCFAEAALEGTTRLRDGRLLNVGSNPDYLPCDARLFEPVFAFAKVNGWVPDRPGYAGIRCDSGATKAIAARTFNESKAGASGFPSIGGRECSPWRTLATDVGAAKARRHDPKYRGRGGVVPRGTQVFILEFVGLVCPDGQGGTFVHDGWCLANDTGGGIFGAHFDVFVGFQSLVGGQWPTPPNRIHIWFEGCETKLGAHYSYGL